MIPTRSCSARGEGLDSPDELLVPLLKIGGILVKDSSLVLPLSYPEVSIHVAHSATLQGKDFMRGGETFFLVIAYALLGELKEFLFASLEQSVVLD